MKGGSGGSTRPGREASTLAGASRAWVPIPLSGAVQQVQELQDSSTQYRRAEGDLEAREAPKFSSALNFLEPS